jgi:hypothetical protein
MRYFTAAIIIISIVCASVSAQASTLSGDIIHTLQKNFNGKVIGVLPYTLGKKQVQLLLHDSRIYIITVNSHTGKVSKITR